jgi:hypothetical protein
MGSRPFPLGLPFSMTKSTRPERLQVLSAKVSPQERALIEALASMAGASLSATARELVTAGARDRLRGLGAPEPGPDNRPAA